MKITLSNIAVSYKNNEVLKNITATFNGGEVVSIIGPNGTGKTTLIKVISNLTKYTGKVTILDSNGGVIPRNKIAYVPQMNDTSSELSVFEVVLLGQIKELGWKIKKENLDATIKILKDLELLHLSKSCFSKLSGGQRQLVILAQALVSKPKVIILDEPTSALDIKHQLQVLDITKNYTKKNSVITLVVIHDLALAARYSDKVLLINDGFVIKNGTPKEVLKEELLKKVYNITVDVSTSNKGYITVTPIEAC